MTTKRHIVNVMRPTETQGARGQIQGLPTTVYSDWPCSIESLNGREIVQARTVFAEATHRVQGYGEPAKRLKERDYLTGGSIGGRILAIQFIDDKQQNGIDLSLICGERTGG